MPKGQGRNNVARKKHSMRSWGNRNAFEICGRTGVKMFTFQTRPLFMRNCVHDSASNAAQHHLGQYEIVKKSAPAARIKKSYKFVQYKNFQNFCFCKSFEADISGRV